jgi:hypothetical protein
MCSSDPVHSAIETTSQEVREVPGVTTGASRSFTTVRRSLY